MSTSDRLTISFYGTVELKERLEQAAKEEDRSVSSVIRRILDAHLNLPEQTKSTRTDNGATRQ